MQPFVPDKLPPEKIDWANHVTLISQANRALARFDGMIQSMVNPDILLAPMTTQEAVLSSRIEGTQADFGDVYQWEAYPDKTLSEPKRNDIQEVLNYREALQAAVIELETRPLSLNLIKDLHSILLNSVRGQNKDRGSFRRIQNFIGQAGKGIEQATFVPPSPEKVLPALDNWEKYIHIDEKDPLVQLAIIKAQFEIIHPFLDGNGRIGRMLVPLFLYEKKILSKPVFYISAYLDLNRDTYYKKLHAVSNDGDWDGWIQFFLLALAEQSKQNTEKTKAIVELYDRLKTEAPPKLKSNYTIQAIDALFARPIFSSSDFIKQSHIPKDTALRLINKMSQPPLSILSEIKPGAGSRSPTYAFTTLVKITES